MTRPELKQAAKDQLAGKWWMVGLSLAAINIIMGLCAYIPVIGIIAVFLVGGPIQLGITIYSLKIARGEKETFGTLFEGFNYFGKALGLMLLQSLFIFLWSLLFIIPGIIKAYSYSMAFYILAENPEMGVYECIQESRKMTHGYKLDLFILELSFIGWGLIGSAAMMLCVFVMGMGLVNGSAAATICGIVLWIATMVAMIALLTPYMLQSFTNMYNDIKKIN